MAKKSMNKRKGIFLVVFFLLINVGVCATSDPIDIHETNLRDVHATVSWITSSEVTGWINYIPSSDTRWGQVFKADGVTPASGTIVYVQITDNDGAGSAGDSSLLSYLIKDADGGFYMLNLGNARTADLGSYFSYSASGDNMNITAYAAGDESVDQVIDTSTASPLPAMVMPGTPPTISPALPDITFDEDGCNDTVDLDDYVSDADEPDAALSWSASGNTHVHVTIPAGHVANFTADADWYGSDYVTDVDNLDSEINWSCVTNSTNLTATANNITKILNLSAGLVDVTGEDVMVTCTATDPNGLSDTDSFIVSVLEVNDPPVIAPALPDITFDEDGCNDTIDLDDYVSDEEDADAALSWSASGNTHVHVTIPAGHVANFTADADWYGNNHPHSNRYRIRNSTTKRQRHNICHSQPGE
ncbi:MAG: hypothetical protein B6U72_02740 [Candidatus Altiarchaeales archaeon ex4484_2]|nr:MAG: hypothetical protein B6U72_02740 [Candidatus Altiarchaeales archaeon ex4484_2]